MPRAVAATALILICEVCERRIHGDTGFLAVDRRTAAAALAGRGPKAPWFIVHRDCCPQAVALLNPYFRIWSSRVRTTDDLLDAMAQLSRLSWFAGTAWGVLARKILADSARAQRGTEMSPASEQSRQRRAERLADVLADDVRHGTELLYGLGCRCEECTQARKEAARCERAARQAACKLGPDSPHHGTYNGYSHYKCRCDSCREANKFYRARREKAKALAAIGVPEGDAGLSAPGMSLLA